MNDRDRDREDRPHVEPPAIDPTDRRVHRLRDKAMDLLADARIHVQRLEEIGEHLGLTPDLVEGMGDELYRAVVAQMDFAAKVFERSQVAAERFMQLHGPRRASGHFHRVDIRPPNDRGNFDFTVCNASSRSARVEVKIEFVPDGAAHDKVGTQHLKGGQQTSVEVEIAGSNLKPGVHPGEVRVVLEHPDHHRVELPRQYFEVWVHKS